MNQSDKTMSYIDDMLNALKHTARFIENMSYETFRHDHKTLFALKHALGIVGKTAQKMPPSLREQYPNIPWREMEMNMECDTPLSTQQIKLFRGVINGKSCSLKGIPCAVDQDSGSEGK